ncbi:MAG: hypothetical protein IPK04_14635 [Bdellovibrionales bacterium]|jgi:hypothetical protein|nr:hypothetical protein [Bdellovibrionales bacterium]
MAAVAARKNYTNRGEASCGTCEEASRVALPQDCLPFGARKILSWGLYHQITQHQVVTVVTEAVALEQIDLLPAGSLKPMLSITAAEKK